MRDTMSTPQSLGNPILWQPTEERALHNGINSFMQQGCMDNCDALYAWSVAKPAAFWPAEAACRHVRFRKQYPGVLEQRGDTLSAHWLSGGELHYAGHSSPPAPDHFGNLPELAR